MKSSSGRTPISGTTVNNFRFVGNLGYYNESALALQYLRARRYQPCTGCIISVDPEQEGVNWYVYANNRPIILVDPSGTGWIHIYVTSVTTGRRRVHPTVSG